MNLVKLKDISIGQGNYGIGAAAVDYKSNLYKYLRITDINEDGTINENELKSVEDINAKDYLLKENDICFARTGNSTGKSFFYDGTIKDLVYAGFLIKFSLDEKKVNPKYIKYYTLSNKYKNWVKEIQTGSTRGNINAKMYGDLEIELPERTYQDKVVKILETITNKIVLNRHTNNNLYAIANSLLATDFDSNNNIELLHNVIKFIKGKKPIEIVNIKNDNFLKYLTIACINNQEVTYANPEKTIIANNDILMVMDGASSGEVYFSDYGIVGSTLAKIDIINDNYTKEYVFFVLKKYSEIIKNKNTGSAIPHTDKAFINTLGIPIIKVENQEKYKIILDRIQHNLIENINLANIRATLLPKLMNGEIDLDKVEI